MSFNAGRKRNHTGDNSTAGHDYSEEHGGATWDCSDRANGSSSASLWQEEEACPDRVSSSSCPPLAHGGTAHPCEQRQGDGLMQVIISETSPKAPSHQAETGGAESRPDFRVEPMPEIYCFQQDQLHAEAPESGRGTGNAPMRNETSHENEADFGAEWSPRAYYQSDDPGEDNHTAGVDEDEQTETTTSDEDEDVDGTRSDPLIFSIPTLPQPQPRDGVVGGGGGGRNEAGDDTSTTSRSSAAEGAPRVLGPRSDNTGGPRLGDGAELEVVQVRQTEINGDAFEAAGGVEASAASSTTITSPFRCCAHDAQKSVFAERERRSAGRQQQPQSTQHNKHQQKHQHRQHHRLSVESPKHPLGQPQHHHQHQRQRRRQHQQPHPLWQQPQRRVSAGDQVDRSGGNLM